MRKIVPMLIIWMLWACQPTPFEHVQSTYDNGKPKLIRTYKSKDMKVLIKETSFYPDGGKKMEGSFKNDLRDGTWSYWYSNGNLWSRGNYEKGNEKGIKTVWHENGQKYYEGYSDNGVRKGIWKYWDETGKIIKEINYDKK